MAYLLLEALAFLLAWEQSWAASSWPAPPARGREPWCLLMKASLKEHFLPTEIQDIVNTHTH